MNEYRTVVHIAGSKVVRVADGRIMQHCVKCGLKLVDSLNCYSVEGGPMRAWKPGALVGVVRGQYGTVASFLVDADRNVDVMCDPS